MRHMHIVLDSNPTPTGEIDPWLDGEGHPRRQPLGIVATDIWRLVGLQPDPVPGTVGEEIGVARLGDGRSGSIIHRGARRSRTYGIASGEIGMLNDPMDSLELGVGFAQGKG